VPAPDEVDAAIAACDQADVILTAWLHQCYAVVEEIELALTDDPRTEPSPGSRSAQRLYIQSIHIHVPDHVTGRDGETKDEYLDGLEQVMRSLADNHFSSHPGAEILVDDPAESQIDDVVLRFCAVDISKSTIVANREAVLDWVKSAFLSHISTTSSLSNEVGIYH
jgi:hypothetical protein